jgi:SAM-dependent methyltransferase
MDRASHWEQIFARKSDTQVSWYQPDPELSVKLIAQVQPSRDGCVIDVGGGTSVLVDRLLGLGYDCLTVLDISALALARSRDRLGERAGRVRWLNGDITEMSDLGSYSVWHDRAAFHFLTANNDRRRYAEIARRTISSGGHAIIATFAPDGPDQCSGLEVCRYDAQSLVREMGSGFHIEQQVRETHTTPWGTEQPFVYTVLQRSAQVESHRCDSEP